MFVFIYFRVMQQSHSDTDIPAHLSRVAGPTISGFNTIASSSNNSNTSRPASSGTAPSRHITLKDKLSEIITNNYKPKASCAASTSSASESHLVPPKQYIVEDIEPISPPSKPNISVLTSLYAHNTRLSDEVESTHELGRFRTSVKI